MVPYLFQDVRETGFIYFENFLTVGTFNIVHDVLYLCCMMGVRLSTLIVQNNKAKL